MSQSLFDGSAVVLDLLVEGEVAIADQGIGFVPLAHYAEHLGYADCPLHYERYEASIWQHPDGTGTN